MKSVHVVPAMEPGMGGPPRVVAGLTDMLRSAGVETLILTTHDAAHPRETVATGTRITSCPRSFPEFWRRAPRLAEELLGQAADADILHLHGMWDFPQLTAAGFARRAGKPHILRPQGELEPWRMRRQGWPKFLKKLTYLRLLGGTLVQRAACLHVLSAFEENGARQAGYSGPIAIVPNGVRMEEFKSLPSPEEASLRWPELRNRRVVLFLSRLSPEKGLNQLIPAWKEIVRRPSLADAMLVLAGPNDRGYGHVVNGLIESHDLGGHVLQTGMVTGKDRLRLLSRADVYTLPSFSEGFSMSLLEAMACGNVAVYTPGCNFPEAEKAGAGICVDPTVGELRDAIAGCLEMDPRDSRKISHAAKRLIETEYTWEAVAAKMRTLYQCILDGAAIPRFPKPFGQADSTLRRSA